MLTRGRLVVVALAPLLFALMGVSASSAATGAPPVAGNGKGDSPSASGSSSNGSISAGSVQAVIETSGQTETRETFRRSVSVPVPRRCWYGPGATGKAYYDYWGPGGPASDIPTLDAYRAQGLLHDGYEDHATDTEGRWYEPRCAAHVPGAEQVEYMLSHPGVYVMPGEPAPAVEESVDPEVLAEIAAEHMQLPTGTIRWNPTLEGSGATVVNTETFVWVENSTTAVEVTASVPGVWSRVQARMTSMTLSAPGTGASTCPDTGTPYSPGMTTSTCAITFTRSTAGMPVKDGQTLPTVTLTATATWEATWTSSLDPTARPLDTQTLTTTGEIPVAEVQTIVTG